MQRQASRSCGRSSGTFSPVSPVEVMPTAAGCGDEDGIIEHLAHRRPQSSVVRFIQGPQTRPQFTKKGVRATFRVLDRSSKATA